MPAPFPRRGAGRPAPTTLLVPPRRADATQKAIPRSAPAVLLAALALGGSVAAATPNAIEGVWSFNGGAVAIQQLPNGAFQGTVVEPTTFAE